MRTLPPAGTPISGGEVVRWIARSMRPGRELAALREQIHARYPAHQVFFFASGRALLTLALEAIREGTTPPPHDPPSVIVPGYTCHSVAASVVRAGLRVHPVDIDPKTLDYDRKQLEVVDTTRVIAIASANLYGIPNDLPFLERFAEERSIAFLDDAAQAMHAQVDGRYAGTFGDAGLFSLDKGKNITTIQGGVLLVQDPALARRVARRVEGTPASPARRTLSRAIELMAYSALLRPSLYWIPDRMLDLGGTPWSPPTPVERFSGRMAPMASILLDRIEEITEGRVDRARRLTQRLAPGAVGRGIILPGFETEAGHKSRAVLPRLPVLLRDRGERDRTLRALQGARLGASRSYPVAIVDIPEAQAHLAPGTVDTPGARQVAETILTLPTHPYLSDDDIETISRIVLSSGPPQ